MLTENTRLMNHGQSTRNQNIPFKEGNVQVARKLSFDHLKTPPQEDKENRVYQQDAWLQKNSAKKTKKKGLGDFLSNERNKVASSLSRSDGEYIEIDSILMFLANDKISCSLFLSLDFSPECDISLCTATTQIDLSANTCTWKLSSQTPAMRRNIQNMNGLQRKPLSSNLPFNKLNQSMNLVSVVERNTASSSLATNNKYGGVTIGIANLLQKDRKHSTTLRGAMGHIKEEAEDEESNIQCTSSHNGILMNRQNAQNLNRNVPNNLVHRSSLQYSESKKSITSVESKSVAFVDQQSLKKKKAEEKRQLVQRVRQEQQRKKILQQQQRVILQRREEERQRCLEQARQKIKVQEEEAKLRKQSHAVSSSLAKDEEKSTTINSYSLHSRHWQNLDASTFNVRGKNYLSDKKKVPSAASILRLMMVDFVQVDTPIMGICSHPKGRIQQMLKSGSKEMPPFIFCVNMVLPGVENYHLVMYWAIDSKDQFSEKHYSNMVQKFLFSSDDEYRNKALKMIPIMTEGSFWLKAAVGTKPFILGKYLDTKYVRGERYLEAVIDVSSSATTKKLLRLGGLNKSKIVAKIAFVLEANEAEALPENILCSVEVNNEDFDGPIPMIQH